MAFSQSVIQDKIDRVRLDIERLVKSLPYADGQTYYKETQRLANMRENLDLLISEKSDLVLNDAMSKAMSRMGGPIWLN